MQPKEHRQIIRYDRRGQIPNCVSIDERPAIVDTKERVGDLEIDTVIGKNHKGALGTAVERNTKFSCIKRVHKKEADLVAKVLIEMLSPFKELLHTITSNNGKEFSQQENIAAALNAKF